LEHISPFLLSLCFVQVNHCLESALRVLINISHENPTWCELLLHQRLMIPVISSLIAISLHTCHDEDADERDAQAFDRLCLALGLLTNLVQANKESKDLCRETSAHCSLVSILVPLIPFFRTRSFVSGPPSVRLQMQLSQRRQCFTMSCFRL
jgi:hypothetical protein